MELENKIRYWQERAFYDIESAKVMLDSGRYLYVAFMCHQAAEKILKAYYWNMKNEEPPYIHNLLKLSVYSGIDSSFSEEQRILANTLTPLYIEARYPSDKQKIYEVLTKEITTNLFKDTKELVEWINQLLK